jgi:hypothetical protein
VSQAFSPEASEQQGIVVVKNQHDSIFIAPNSAPPILIKTKFDSLQKQPLETGQGLRQLISARLGQEGINDNILLISMDFIRRKASRKPSALPPLGWPGRTKAGLPNRNRIGHPFRPPFPQHPACAPPLADCRRPSR